MNKRVLLVGGTVLKAHLENNCFSETDIVKKYFGMSPFSLGEPERIQNVPKERLTLPLRFDVNNDFKGFLNKNPADFIFLDLQKILVDLLEINGRFCTNQPDSADVFYRENQDKIIKVTDCGYERFYPVFDSFARIISDRFNAENIILLSSFVPDFYVTGGQVREHSNKFLHNDRYRHFEKRFASITGCVYYDKSRYYFNEKYPGKRVKFAVFESYYYTEAAEDFMTVLGGGTVSVTPDYGLCVKRYIKYGATLNKSFLSAFLSSDDTVDRFLMCCPENYAKNNLDNFVMLKSDAGRMKGLRFRIRDNDFYKTYCAFVSASKNPDSAIKNADLLFENGIMIPQLLKSVRGKSSIRFAKQINYSNYGDFYHGRQPRSLPRAVDVIGSCVSRFIFNFSEPDFAVNNYAFHYMPVMTDKKARYDDKLFNESVWEQKMMKLQADCGLRDFLSKNKADWAVVDLFPLIELTSFMIDGKPIGSAGHFGKSNGFDEVLIYEKYTEEEISYELKKYADLLMSLYSDRIILVASRRQFLKVDDTNKIVHYTNEQINSFRNGKIRVFEKLFCDYTGCRYVDIVGQFFSCDRSFVSLSPVHYEDDCYIEEGKIIKRIIDEEPAKRVFSDYDVDTRIKRIINFKKSGNSEDALCRIFTKPQDKALLCRSAEEIEKDADYFRSLYSE